ncbi:MAG: lysylphosphatidylglycerol synthase transmembrane domain-containing protein [Chloroflexota bacterium]
MTFPPSPARINWKTAAQVGGSLLSLLLLVGLVYQQGWDEVISAVRRIPLPVVLVALTVMLLSRLCVVLRWFVLLRSAHAAVSFKAIFELVFVGLFASNFLPSTIGGDVVRLAGAVMLRVDAGLSAASLVADRLIGMAGMSVMLPAGLITITSRAAAGLAALPAAVLPVLPRRWGEKIKSFIRQVLVSLRHWLQHPRGLLAAFAATFGHMACTFFSVSLLLSALGTPLDFWKIGGLWSLSYFITLLPVSINGLGLQEVSISYLYHTFGGVPLENTLTLSLMMRLLFVGASLPGALFLPLLAGLRKADSDHTS